jgi:hypothetical protein
MTWKRSIIKVIPGDYKNLSKIIKIVSLTRTSRTIKDLTCPGNYKLQIPNYKQITNPKLQITNIEVSFGQVLNACGEENKMVSYI